MAHHFVETATHDLGILEYYYYHFLMIISFLNPNTWGSKTHHVIVLGFVLFSHLLSSFCLN